jgi:membrane-bound metal-dependent hydrolase YbcI (DUF457 family)
VFIGHFGLGLASKRAAPDASLGILMAAPLLLDLLWPIALLLGLERVRIDPGNTLVTPLDFAYYPYTHSLVMALVWSALLGAGYLRTTGDRRGTLVIGLGVFSHWAFDWIVHRPDLPLAPGSSIRLGLGLWNSYPATLAVEIPIFVCGVAIYARCTNARNRAGTIALWAMVFLLGAIYLANLVGPPPPSPRAIAFTALVLWVFVPWAWWIDKNRQVDPQLSSGTRW